MGHGGYCPGYQSHLLLQPAAKVATVFMTNSNGIDSRAFAQTAYDIVAPAVKQAMENPTGAKPHDPRSPATPDATTTGSPVSRGSSRGTTGWR